jgi:hypothetical protein
MVKFITKYAKIKGLSSFHRLNALSRWNLRQKKSSFLELQKESKKGAVLSGSYTTLNRNSSPGSKMKSLPIGASINDWPDA